MQQHKFNIGDIVWVKYNITEYGDSIRTRIISDILVTNNWQGDISYFFLWTDKPSPIYENEIVWLYQKSSPSSEDKPIENEQGFWEAIMLLKDVRQYATDMTSHADSYEAQSAYKKYKKLLSILENKIFTI